jgi:hypothetical protein
MSAAAQELETERLATEVYWAFSVEDFIEYAGHFRWSLVYSMKSSTVTAQYTSSAGRSFSNSWAAALVAASLANVRSVYVPKPFHPSDKVPKRKCRLTHPLAEREALVGYLIC